MNFKHLVPACIFAGVALVPALQSSETVFEGFRKPWQFCKGTKSSEKKDAVAIPVKTNGNYIFMRKELTPGFYVCSFEYKYAKPSKGKKENLQFSCVTDHGVYTDLSPRTEWTPVLFRIALTKKMTVKTGFGFKSEQENTLKLRNFRLARLSGEDYAKMEYLMNRDFWFNRSTERTKAAITEIDASDHILGGKAVQIAAAPDFPENGNLIMTSLSEPLPEGKKFRLTAWIKGDKEGTLRIALAGNHFEERAGTEWKKITCEFLSKMYNSPLTQLSFVTLDKNLRTLAVKDIELERVK